MQSLKSRSSRRRSPKKIWASVLIAIALLGGGSYAYLVASGQQPFGSDNSSPSNKIETPDPAPPTLSDEDAKNKQDFIENEDKIDTPDASDAKLTLSLTEQGDEVVVQSKLTGLTDGTCTLTARNGTKTITRTAPVIFQSQYSTCAGFSVATSELGAGTWSVMLKVTSGTESASATKTLAVSG